MSVEDLVEGPVAPDEDVFSALAEGAVESTRGDPGVDCFDAQPEQVGELARREDGREFGKKITLEYAGDLVARL